MFQPSSFIPKNSTDASYLDKVVNSDDEFIDSDVDEIPLNDNNNVAVNSYDEYNNNDDFVDSDYINIP